MSEKKRTRNQDISIQEQKCEDHKMMMTKNIGLDAQMEYAELAVEEEHSQRFEEFGTCVYRPNIKVTVETWAGVRKISD